MIKKIEGEIPLWDIDSLHLNAVVDIDCPNCKNAISVDFNTECSLPYPKINEDQSILIHCGECAITYELPVVLKSVKAVIHYDIRDIVEAFDNE